MSKLAEANRALREKKYDRAVLLYQQILQTQPELYNLVRGNVRILRQRYARGEPPGFWYLENDQAFVELCLRLDRCVDEFGKEVSIVIPTLNAAALLERLLTTFFQVNTHQPMELIVVDHGSTDGTAERVAGFMRQYPGVIRWVNREMNHSFSSSCNLGARLARYPYLLFLQDDLIYTADVVPPALAKLREPGIGAVEVRLEDDPGALPAGRTPTVQHTGVRFGWNERRQYCQPEQIRHPTVAAVVASGVFPAVTAAFLLCRQADFEALEGFCAAYEQGLEAVDFCLRLGVQLRKRCWCVNEMALQHREGATRNRGDQAARRAIIDRNHRFSSSAGRR
jgi:GT2 family glycosyltransferase